MAVERVVLPGKRLNREGLEKNRLSRNGEGWKRLEQKWSRVEMARTETEKKRIERPGKGTGLNRKDKKWNGPEQIGKGMSRIEFEIYHQRRNNY